MFADETREPEPTAAQLLADLYEEYRDDDTKEACDACADCGRLVMCRYHSLLSALSRRTWTNGAIERADLKAALRAIEEEMRAFARGSLNAEILAKGKSVPRIVTEWADRVAALRS